jgi:MoaA/NifB/PqqE/SkfB family radical SAM enzyme
MRSETLIRLNRVVASNRLKFLAVLAADLVRARYMILYLDPVAACNLKCRMCYFSDPEWRVRNPVARFSDDDIHRLAEMFFPQAAQLHLGGAMEPTLYKGFPALVSLAKRHNVPFVSLTTNGQLLTKADLRVMIGAGLDEITLSTHGTTRETYENMMQGASFEIFQRALRAIVELKLEHKKRKPTIRINYTVNPDNLPELRGFFNSFGDYDITTLQVRPMVDVGNTEYKKKDLTIHRDKYNSVIDSLISECRRRGVYLLANKHDPENEKNNKYAVVYEKAVVRTLSPRKVWKESFDFRLETYREHSKRIGFRRELLKYVLQGDASLLNKSPLASSRIF